MLSFLQLRSFSSLAGVNHAVSYERRNLMLRKSAVFFSFLCIAATGAFMSCGGGSSHFGPTPCTGSFNVVGDWKGSVTEGGNAVDLFGTIDSTGNAVFFDGAADVVTVSPLTGACSFSSTLTAYISVADGGPQTESGTATGNVTSATSLNGSESVIGGTNGTFTFSSYSPLGTGSVTALSGSVTAEVEGEVATDFLNLTLAGTVGNISYTGTDGICTFSGAFSQEGTNDIYDVTFNVAGSGSGCSGNFTGVGFESDSDLLGFSSATGTYLYAVITSNGAPFVVEIPPSGADALRRAHNPRMSTSFSKVFGFDRRLPR
jgi:hypothetical protein